MKTIITNKILVLIVSMSLLLSIASCDKEPTAPDKDAPALPPVQSMQMDLSLFNNPMGNSLNKTTESKNNFIAAAARVFYINAVVVLAAAIPTAVFAAAISQEPVLQEDGKFHWIYSVTQGLQKFSVDLAGWIDTPKQEFVWEVYISSNTHSPNLEHFLWYEGRSKIGNAEGWWMFHDDKSPDSLVDVLKIDWEIPNENESELVFINVNTTSSDYGDSLTYKNENFDCYLIYYDASKTQHNTIYWNAETGAGYIEWFDYNNGQISYWDENQDDIPGPPA